MNLELLQDRVDKLEEKVETLTRAIDSLERLLTKFEGVSSFVKFLFFIVTPLLGAFVWARDHIKF